MLAYKITSYNLNNKHISNIQQIVFLSVHSLGGTTVPCEFGSTIFEEESSSLILFNMQMTPPGLRPPRRASLQVYSSAATSVQVHKFVIIIYFISSSISEIGSTGTRGACDTRGAYGRSRRLASSAAAGPRRDFGVARAIILYRCYATEKCVHAHYTTLLLLLYLVGRGLNVCQTRTYPHTHTHSYIYTYICIL